MAGPPDGVPNTMRVLILAERFIPDVAGGGELSAALVAEAVASQPGVEVSVLTQGDGRTGVVRGVEVSYTIPRGRRSLPDEVTRGELLTARAAPQVARSLREFDMVHCVSPRAIPAAVAAGRLARRPATSVMNDNWSTCYVHSHVRRDEYCPTCTYDGFRQCVADIGGNLAATPFLWRQFRRRIKSVRKLDGVVAVCPAIGRLLRDHDVEVPIEVIPLPMEFGPWEGWQDREPEEGLVVFVGRLAHGKGVIEAIEAFAKVAEGRPRARLTVVGDGPLLESAQRRAAELGMAQMVGFTGWTPPEELPNIYGRAQVVLSPFMRVEALGRVTLEAAAAGRPVVTTDIGGGAEVLHMEPGAGRVVPWDDTSAWAAALGELLDDPHGSASMGREARRRLEELYGEEGVGPRYLEFFQRILGK